MSKLTKPQRARLDRLATYLEGLPADFAHFGMESWIDTGNDSVSAGHYALKNGGVASCGTSACAAGHGPAAGILVPKALVEINKDERWADVDWIAYCRLFTQDNDAHHWLFNGQWGAVDDHHWGAAARIRRLLDKGVPREFLLGAECSLHRFGADLVPLYAPYRIDAKATAADRQDVL